MRPQTNRSASAGVGSPALEHVRRLEGHVPSVVTDLLHAWDGSDLAVHTQVHGNSYNGPATLTFSTRGDTISALRITTA